MSDKEQPLNGQQMQAVRIEIDKVTRAILGDLDTRKLALRHACDLSANKGGHEVVKLAEQMHTFLTAGARDSAKPNQV